MKRESATAEYGVILLAIILLSFWTYPFATWTTDDSFISYRYAENLANGQGLVFNPNEKVEGFSNLLWTLSLALGSRLELEPIHLSKALSILSLIGIIIISDKILRIGGAGVWLRACLAACLACDTSLVLYSVSGLETVSYGLLILIFAKLKIDYHHQDRDNVGKILVLCFLIMLGRPEGVLYPFFFLSAYLTRFSRIPRKHLMFIVAFFAAVAVGLSVRYWYFGDIVPATFYAKPSGSFGREFPVGGIRYLNQAVKDLGYVWPVLLIAYFFDIKSPRLAKYRSALAWSIVPLGVFCFYAGGDWMPNSRFLVPIFPLVYILGVLVLSDIVTYLNKKSLSKLATAIIISTISISFYHQYTMRAEILRNGDEIPYDLMNAGENGKPLGLWLQENFPESFVVATKRIGVVPYYSKLRTLDLYGLVDKRIGGIIFEHGTFQEPRVGAEIGEYVLEKRPELIILHSTDRETFTPRGSHEEFLYERIEDDYRVIKDYAFSPSYFNRVFLRRDVVLGENK